MGPAKKLTRGQLAVLYLADKTGSFSAADMAICPGIHFCPDWDAMPICDDSPEIDGCLCGPREPTP